MIDVLEIENAEYDVYQMPRYFSGSRGYHGLFYEPTEYYKQREIEEFWIISDWVIVFKVSSKAGGLPGKFRVEARLEDPAPERTK